jgi:predicted amidophosphoribosyltransferase
MALIKCPTCGREIAEEVVTCPGCGATNPKAWTLNFVLTIGFLALVVWAWHAYCF